MYQPAPFHRYIFWDKKILNHRIKGPVFESHFNSYSSALIIILSCISEIYFLYITDIRLLNISDISFTILKSVRCYQKFFSRTFSSFNFHEKLSLGTSALNIGSFSDNSIIDFWTHRGNNRFFFWFLGSMALCIASCASSCRCSTISPILSSKSWFHWLVWRFSPTPRGLFALYNIQ